MKIKQGKIKNLNKKLITSALTFTLLTSSLIGCTNTSIKDIKYETNNDGYVQCAENTFDKKYVKQFSFCNVINCVTGDEYYTIAFIPTKELNIYDIFTRDNLSEESTFIIEYIYNVNEYLEKYELGKEQYTEKDLNDILNYFVEEMGNQQKIKVK